MRFVKMHGLGNDFIITEDFKEKLPDPAGKARDLCRRFFSVGADGLVLIQSSVRGDLRMRIFNPDGSEAEMCGNALRCVALYARRYLGQGETLIVETGGGLKEVVITGTDIVRVNMGRPELRSNLIPVAGPEREIIREEIVTGSSSFTFAAVSMGNPHCVIFLEEGEPDISPEAEGPRLETHHFFPNHTNVEFARVTASGRVEVKVWERGAGATMACGTGACAVVVAGVLQNRLETMPVEVVLPGGVLSVSWKPGGEVYMEGPAEEIYSGTMSH